jgi:hypothetical protein
MRRVQRRAASSDPAGVKTNSEGVTDQGLLCFGAGIGRLSSDCHHAIG